VDAARAHRLDAVQTHGAIPKAGRDVAQELATLRDAQRMSPAVVMRDPYILDFLGLRETWQEGDLEVAIIREMESFLLALGTAFSFLARQKRIQIDDEDFHMRPSAPKNRGKGHG
jgi:predicted nuclease of restriction endonuclease-like (RecB) superfamily